MATFVPDKPPLTFSPMNNGYADAAAFSFSNYIELFKNEVDIFPVYLMAGKTYQITGPNYVEIEVWDDFARQLVWVPDQVFAGGTGGGVLSALYIEESGLYYIRVELGISGGLEPPASPFYGLVVHQWDGDRGPNRTPSSLPDAIDGGEGADTIVSGDGADTVRGLGGDDLVLGGFGDDDLNGNLGNDTVSGHVGRDFVRGGQGDDKVSGQDDDDWHVNGNIGNDLVYGDDGNDMLFGGPGFDQLFGGNHSDTLSGDLGNDSLHGDDGADRFDFRSEGGNDVVFGFDGGQGDRVWIETDINGSGIATFDDLVARLTEGPDGARLDLGGGNTVLFLGTPKDAIWSGVVEFG